MLQQSHLIEQTDDDWRTPEQALLTDNSIEILRFAADAVTTGLAVALVTLVDIRGGGARALGAQMAVREDGLYCGFVSGGCVEAAAAYEAMEVINSGNDRRIVYGKGSPWFDIVLPCGGSIMLSIHKLRSARPLLAVLAALERRRPAGLRYNPQLQTLQCIVPDGETGWSGECFDVCYRPCTRVVIYGRSVEAEVTAKLAQAVGYDVCTSNSTALRTASAFIDSDTAVILLYHDLNRELPFLQAALSATPFYIGALGSRRTHLERVQKLADLGWHGRDIERIKAPIGIFPKARDAHSLALSVLADVAAARLSSIDKEKIS
ncbi:XdhC family protein [Enterobacteriaceae bacterium H18W14]|uniref:XdhC family protein n=1 Tax=Dryocola boscaweniae TaxID=2925397 RepID=UPI0022F0BB21|nr:XdhC family protein [Dryocola boscaweniae]MCT4717220.1 XdhC family protein [Dryocola boscaweniae]